MIINWLLFYTKCYIIACQDRRVIMRAAYFGLLPWVPKSVCFTEGFVGSLLHHSNPQERRPPILTPISLWINGALTNMRGFNFNHNGQGPEHWFRLRHSLVCWYSILLTKINVLIQYEACIFYLHIHYYGHLKNIVRRTCALDAVPFKRIPDWKLFWYSDSV